MAHFYAINFGNSIGIIGFFQFSIKKLVATGLFRGAKSAGELKDLKTQDGAAAYSAQELCILEGFCDPEDAAAQRKEQGAEGQKEMAEVPHQYPPPFAVLARIKNDEARQFWEDNFSDDSEVHAYTYTSLSL